MTYILLSDILTVGLRVTLCFFLIFRLLAAGKPEKKSIVTGFAGALIIALLLFFTALPAFYRIALETIWIAVCANRLQKADARMSLFVAIFYEIAVSFWQFLFMAGMGVLFRSPKFLDYGTVYGQLAVWALHILLASLTVLLYKKQPTAGKANFRFASAAALAGFIAVVTLSEQTILPIPDDTLSMWTFLAVVLMMSILAFNMNRQYEAEKELAKLKSEQTELLNRNYNTLNNAYAVNARLFHDFHNHIGALRQLLSHEKYTEALQYLDELQRPIREMADSVRTGDETADYLINSKAAAAAANKIQWQAQVEFPRGVNIKSADLCAILGNLLDNALEAAGQVSPPKQRFVRLTIRRINQMLVIKVENSFAAPPIHENGLLKTTKKDAGLHGWGLKSARTAAEKYDGMVQTSYTGDTFQAVATLSYPDP